MTKSYLKSHMMQKSLGNGSFPFLTILINRLMTISMAVESQRGPRVIS